MREIALFVEDSAHRQIIGALVRRLADEYGVDARLEWRSAVRGHGRVAREFGDYLRDLGRQGDRMPDLIVVATDANCSGFAERAKEFNSRGAPAPMVLAIPSTTCSRARCAKARCSMSDPKQARVLLEAAERDISALRGMGDAAVFADEIFGFHAQQAAEKLFMQIARTREHLRAWSDSM